MTSKELLLDFFSGDEEKVESVLAAEIVRAKKRYKIRRLKEKLVLFDPADLGEAVISVLNSDICGEFTDVSTDAASRARAILLFIEVLEMEC